MKTHEIVKDVQGRMDKTVEAIRDELSKIRSGKATPTLLDPVRVDAYGSKMPLNQVASVSTPDPRMILVQPWDKSLIGAIEKAVMTSDLGLNPANDGTVIRIPLPALNEERRNELVKVCRKIVEEGRIALRNIRRDGNDQYKKLEKNHEMSEDEVHNHLDEIQEATDAHVKKLEAILQHKETEIMEV
ncbi:MAG: ribosome recycling factor [Calditrichaeota bacterium]|nr:MAG: ribosome recycling factor [Calditrichota bacterium]